MAIIEQSSKQEQIKLRIDEIFGTNDGAGQCFASD